MIEAPFGWQPAHSWTAAHPCYELRGPDPTKLPTFEHQTILPKTWHVNRGKRRPGADLTLERLSGGTSTAMSFRFARGCPWTNPVIGPLPAVAGLASFDWFEYPTWVGMVYGLGHHYGLVEVYGLSPGSETAYTVAVDGEVVWPEPESPFPPSRIRTMRPYGTLRLAFGSCRMSVPHDRPYERKYGADVLRAFTDRLMSSDETWPDALLLLGDQVYQTRLVRNYL